jgi:hypothetical protein
LSTGFKSMFAPRQEILMIDATHFTSSGRVLHHRRMGPTLPSVVDRSATALVVDDVWSAARTAPWQARADRNPDPEEPPIERPAASSARRLVTVAATVAVVALALLFPALGESDGFSDQTTRSLSALLVLGYLVSIAAFAWWSHAQRLTIDALRWRSFRRPTKTWRWAVGWTATPVVAVLVGVGVSLATPNRLWLVGLGAVLVAARMMLLQALGTNMARVVRGAKRWLPLWGLVTGIVDVLIVDIAITGVFDTRVEPGRLDDLVAWLLPLLVMHALFVFTYMKRVERWVLEWWDHRYGISEEEVLAVLLTIRHGSDGSNDYSGRRLIPTIPFRLAVFASYLAVAGTALWNGVNVWASRDQLSLASDVDAAVDRIGASAVAFVAAVCAVQIAQGLWSMVAAWNARRCTIAAPSVIGMLGLFLAGPAMLAYGVLVTDDRGAQLTFIGIALLLNLVCWALSFSVIATTLDVLGRSSELIGRWGVTVSLHWVVIFMFRPLDRIDDDLVYAGVVVAISLVDAVIFIAASLAAWRAMQHFDVATAEYRQVRRISV